MSIKRKTTILVSLAVAVPLVAAVGIKKVAGSEPPGRLVVNGDGTVTDTVTKLIWQQATASNVTPAAAVTTCSGLSIGSHTSGWRVPTVKELVSTVDYESATAPMIDTAAFPGTVINGGQSNIFSFYYSATPVPGQAGSFYFVSFLNGTVGSYGGGSSVRCVHASP